MANDLALGQDIAPAQRATAEAFQRDLDTYTPNLMQALPAHVSVDKFKRVLVTAVSANPDLFYANRRTLFTAAVKCASDGLLPDGREAALVVYNTTIKQRDPQSGIDREIRIPAVQYLPMVAGIRKRMRNTGDVLSADAHVVYEKDHFKYKLGDDGFIDHEPAGLADSPGKPLGAYAIIKLKSGEVLRDVMRHADIEKARAVSKAKNSPMWTTFWDEGARKTVLRRCAKSAPQSAELESLLNRDEEEPPMLQPFEALPPVAPEPERPADSGGGFAEPADDRPIYTVVDLDGVEHEFREMSTAETAMTAVLVEAAKQGLPRLEGAWESQDFREPFPRDSEQRMRERYDGLRADLAPKPAQAPPAQEGAGTRGSIGTAPVSSPAAPQPPAAPSSELPFPGDLPAGQRLGLSASGDDSPEHPAGGSGGRGPDAGRGEPSDERPSLAVAPPLRQGRPDWRTWMIALFLPKVRKAATSEDLAFLLGDNDEHLTAARAALAKDDAAALDAAIEQRWKDIG